MDITKYKQYLRPELHQMLNDIVQSTGTVVDKLPPVNITAENNRYFVKNSKGQIVENIKVGSKYQTTGGGISVDSLPSLDSASEGSIYFVKNPDGSHTQWAKLDGKFKQGSTFS
jgi:hypothetical protein